MSLTYPKHQCTVRIRPNIRKSGDPKSTLFAEQPASMLPRLFPPVKAFNPSYSQALFTQLDAILALNGVTAPPVMHAVLLNCYGETYRSLRWSRREFPASPLSQRVVPAGLQPSFNHDDPSLITAPSTADPATGAS
ncbi:hypothetical protein HPB52_007282 [Rhipicephalus sanguineus]|uniref:Uncharacterized protein n=1 Tax=Rhipicephalus sanguineus TaxID=34632 RepID=A0A9D4PIE8_RHISA|nr:hypothetical protein HPB52_007282 [Rhipicephalus sanguineus]